jgi:diaminopimelate decarboxylase
MTKVLSTPQGKVWAGDISHVPDFLLNDLVLFVKRTEWTGGGEIEFIETIGDQISNQGSVDEMSYYVIDFNPRFPAWILGSIYTGCNLPADLIRQVIEEEQQWEVKTKTQATCVQVDQLCSGDNRTSEELFDKLYEDNCGFGADCFDSDGYKGDASSLSDSDEDVDCCTLTQSKNHSSRDFFSERRIATNSNKPADEYCDGLICDSPRSMSLSNDDTTASAGYPSSTSINHAFSVTSIKQNHMKYSAIKGSFTRSVVELPRMNYVLDQQLDSPMTLSRGGGGGEGKGNMKVNFMDCAAKTLHRLKNHEQMWVPVNLQRKRKLYCDNNQDVMLSPILEGYHDDFRHEEGHDDMMAVSDLISPITAILECSEDFNSNRVKDDDSRLNENENMRKVERIQEQCQSVCDVASNLIATNFLLPRSRDTEFINTSSEQKSNSTLSSLLRNSVLLATPRYLLSGCVLEENLRDSKTIVSEICNTVNQNHAKTDIRIRPQLCLSVKSQPHAMLLEAARCEQYVAECISLAEVAASLSAGFQPINIILTGPGKFWLGGDEVRVKCVVESLQSAINVTDEASYGNRKLMLGGIYADSLSDLRIILHRLNDSADWLGSHLVGIRFTPSVTVSSRFGIDAMDTLVVEQAASMIHEMPSHFSLGLHFHYAMSNQSGGFNPWLGMLAGFISLAGHFESLCGKPLQVLDFGGGWTPQLIQQPTVRCGLIRLFADMLRNFTVGKESDSMETSRELCVQFELGKSISEQSGGLLCRVLGIREIRTPTAMFAEDDSSYQCGCDDVDSIVPIRRALIVDACIGDLSSPHLHPAFWMPSATDTTPNAGIKHDEWSSLSPGWNEIWGRTCMEFDVLLGYSPLSRMKGGISLPTYLKEGVYLRGEYILNTQHFKD